ncbi:MAG: hypothetical protein SAL07_13320 [Oscillatoria sp. PMC 1051.18]|nr:hypothetical protein [Oscillatoria sp. PMC 1050.18]MEC5030873.1 hypothetical protein [Oscillatoria sp. PMC 1051.18]
MNLKEFNERYLELTRDFSGTNFLIEEPSSPVSSQGEEYNSNILSIPTAVPALVGAMCIFLGIKFNKIIQKRFGKFKKISQNLPCSNCKYFQNNPYLKCAVQPDLVLKQEAKNCQDYLPNTEDESHINENPK